MLFSALCICSYRSDLPFGITFLTQCSFVLTFFLLLSVNLLHFCMWYDKHFILYNHKIIQQCRRNIFFIVFCSLPSYLCHWVFVFHVDLKIFFIWIQLLSAQITSLDSFCNMGLLETHSLTFYLVISLFHLHFKR